MSTPDPANGNSDGHSPDNDAGADNTPGSQPRPSSNHPPTSSANNSSSSHSHTQQQDQQQHHHNMSTLTPSEAGQPPTWDAVVQERDEPPYRQAAFIPRSALLDGAPTGRVSNINTANSLLNTRGYSNVNIDIPLNTQSSLHMELTHDGKVTELVARFESCRAGYSDASEEFQDSDTGSSSIAAHHATEPKAGTVRVHRNEHIELEAPAHTVGHAGQSPRKQLPTHWKPKSSAPKLATAQRAKERTYKKDSESGSPADMRTLRGTGSSVELGKAQSREGATYLTKEALAAVDSSVTLPTSPLSPSKAHGSPSKRLWNSPTGSPLRSSARQQPTFSIKMSPTKSTHLNAGSVSTAHSRASSSVANSFHTAEGSPVRSPASTEDSFRSAADNPENTDVPSLDLMADSGDEQVLPGSGSPGLSANQAKTEGKASSMKPRLAVKIPTSDGGSSGSQKSAETSTLTSATSDSYQSNASWSPVSPVRESRIPRVGATSKIAVPVRSATLQRAQSVKSLATKVKIMQSMHAEPQEVSLPQTPAHEIPLPTTPGPTGRQHVRTVNSSGTTPIIPRTATSSHDAETSEFTSDNEQQLHGSVGNEKTPAHTTVANRHTDVPVTDLVPATLDMESLQIKGRPEAIPLPPSGQTSRAASNATVRAAQDTKDPVLMDPSIIYSRKKSDVFGTALACPPITVPTIIVMMAHTLDIGTVHLNDHATSAAPSRTHDSLETSSVVRGRTDRYVPSVRRHADSEHSTQSSMSSDLRADAPAFVPNILPATNPTVPAANGTSLVPLASLQDLPGLPVDLSALDANGIPYLYFMYQTQVAYEQGFRYGRLRSPKKFKPKKQRSSISAPGDAPPPNFTRAVPVVAPKPATPPSEAATQRMTSAELMPPPPLPASRRQPQENNQRENAHPGPQSQQLVDNDQPFSNQLNFIAEQAALRNRTNMHANSPRHYNVGFDLTTVRNVGVPSGPRKMNPHSPTYYTVPRDRRHPNNGLYGGRGNASGIPMDATAPFPDPVPPQGRPDPGQGQGTVHDEFRGFSIGREACGVVDIVYADERGGGETCNACSPDH